MERMAGSKSSRKDKSMKKIHGRPLPLGVTASKEHVNFAVAVPQGKKCSLLLYHIGEKEPCMSYPMEETVGEIQAAAFEDFDISEYEYNYEIEEEIYPDPYAEAFSGREVWLKETDAKKHEVRCRICSRDYDWGEDEPLKIPYHKVIAYALHVRGFTKDPASGVRHKGTFEGVAEKLPYLKELGINQIQCMPVYEFEERGSRINYWGYGEGYYFAPKSSYASDGDGVKGLKDMVKACHSEGIEVVLHMPFADGTSGMVIQECLRHYVTDYHIDGFILNPYVAPMGSIFSDPVLKKTKIMKYQECFQNVMRRFLKGDEGMVNDVIFWLKHHSREDGIFNYITAHNGFTLEDLVSYDAKHNEPNGENNQDGPDYNYSWNCGAEGASRKKAVLELRKRQIRNAFFLLLLSQGTPCILAGDEFGNSQKGNNNAYCQDNRTGWVNWKPAKGDKELNSFVKDLISLRKKYPVLCQENEPMGIDRAGCGVPEVSYHGEQAWRAPVEVSSRQLGVYYSAALAGGEDCYVVYNMHWLEHDFALPALSGRRKWFLSASTQEGVLKEEVLLEDQRKIRALPRTILLIVGR